MALISALFNPASLVLLPIALGLYYVVPYFVNYHYLKDVPGPFFAKFSNIWLALGAKQGQKFARVHAAHEKYGKVVRVGYNHVSIADEKALSLVYGHGNGFLKDHFYEAFVVRTTGVFNTRDRGEHTRKRKIIAHAFSPGAVGAFEGHMNANIRRWTHQLDKICANPAGNGYAGVNIMPWCSYLAFDIIGDLAFGQPFGMIEKGRDEAEIQLVQGGPVTYAPAVEVLNRRGEVSATLGLLLPLFKFARFIPDPFFVKGVRSVAELNGMAIRAVADRLDAIEKGRLKGSTKAQRVDILQRLIEAKDAHGKPMGRKEITAEALTQLIAGSDTISNTTCAIIYWILHGERAAPETILPRLYAELDTAMTEDIAQYSNVRNLSFLRQCINEAMRLHSTSAIGLPRIVADGLGVSFEGHYFPEGTVLSVPSYSIHHSAEIWGPDVEEFKPDRWLNLTDRQKTAFNPFSYGPRACVGQNIAQLELTIIISTFFWRYDVRLYQKALESHEGFSKKTHECYIGIRRRSVPRVQV